MQQTEIQTFAAKAVNVLMARYDAAKVERLLVLLSRSTRPGSEDRALQDRLFRAIARHVEG